MSKKVIDVFPPSKKEKKKEEHKEQEIQEVKIEPEKKPRAPLWGFSKKAPNPPFKKGLTFSLLFLVLLGAFCYIALSKAEISIWPEIEVFNLIEETNIDKNATAIDSLLKIIPAETLQKEKTIVQTFPVSGKIMKEEKAQGTIKVYNAYSTSAQALIATTRFVSSDGKVFRTPIKVTIPGGTYEKGKLVPGEIDVKVVADQPGEEYNIVSTKFSIPGFAGTDKYTKFYGESFEVMTGGFQEEVAKVTEKDLSQAEETLTKQAGKECNELLQNELQSEAISSKFDYLPDSIQTEIIENFSLTSAEAEAKDFNYQAKAQCQVIVFKKEDIRNYVKEAIIFQIPQDKKLYEESLKINYSIDDVDLETGKIAVSLTISAKIYADVDIFSFKNALKGKSLLEAKLFLENYPKITRASVKFWPFWVNKVPEDLSKIKFNLVID